MTLTKGISHSALNGLLTGSLLALTGFLWFNFDNTFILPLLVAVWWLVLFGCNLLHAYKLANYKFTDGKRFGLQFTHAAMAAVVYWSIDTFLILKPKNTTDLTADVISHAQLEANIYTDAVNLLSNTQLIIPAAFVLSLITGGLLFSILTRPSAK